MKVQQLPIAIIGAGPIGLAAAAHLSLRGQGFVILEEGPAIADNVRRWAHVSMFSPWAINLDAASVQLLEQSGWTSPDPNTIPTGRELIDLYLLPLSQTPQLKSHIQLGTRVQAVSRRRLGKLKSFGRDKAPFLLQIIQNGQVKSLYAKAVIDASGTWKQPNPIGTSGLFGIGEPEHRDYICYGIPDVLGANRPRYAGKRVTVIGGGHSAINALLDLNDLKQQHPETMLNWVLLKAKVDDAYGGLDADELPGRGLVGKRVKELVESKQIEVFTPFFIEEITTSPAGIQLEGESARGPKSILTDEIIAATGLRPDLDMLRELRLALDPAVESPINLAPLIDPNIHSCGSVEPHGEAQLRHPEAGFYIVGMKSYGRAPTFLLATGYEQVRSVTAALSGDWAAAREVRLQLPENGLCGVPSGFDPNQLVPETQNRDS